jgi:hypothetical protein
LIFPDSKRPITTDLLHRLDLSATARECGLGDAWQQTIPIAENKSKGHEQLALVMETPPQRLGTSRRSRR